MSTMAIQPLRDLYRSFLDGGREELLLHLAQVTGRFDHLVAAVRHFGQHACHFLIELLLCAQARQVLHEGRPCRDGLGDAVGSLPGSFHVQ